MLLNNSQMLPARVRNMRQMNDILNAEDIVLVEIERIIDEMYQRASLLHEELVNEQWLEEKLAELVNGIVYVRKRAGTLLVEISLNVRNVTADKENEVIAFVEKWLPAHLGYEIMYEEPITAENYIGALWQDDEIMEMRQVI